MNRFNLLPVNIDSLNHKDLNGESIMEDFLTKNIEIFQVNFFDKSDVELYVEDDIIFLIEAVQDLFSEEKFSNHYVFLGDGSVVLDTNLVNDKNVTINLKISKHLNVDDLTEEIIEMSLKNYVLSWRNLAYQILKEVGHVSNGSN